MPFFTLRAAANRERSILDLSVMSLNVALKQTFHREQHLVTQSWPTVTALSRTLLLLSKDCRISNRDYHRLANA
jgi:hypothetical protein